MIAMNWIALFLAGIFEVVWATAIKQSAGFSRLGPSVVAVSGFLISIGLLSTAMKSLPLGTAYTVWTGIGAIGAFAAGIMFFGESASAIRFLAAILIVSGLTLMKIGGQA